MYLVCKNLLRLCNYKSRLVIPKKFFLTYSHTIQVRDSTLEFKGVHVTKSTVFVTDSKSFFYFSVTSTVLIPDFLSKTVEVAF